MNNNKTSSFQKQDREDKGKKCPQISVVDNQGLFSSTLHNCDELDVACIMPLLCQNSSRERIFCWEDCQSYARGTIDVGTTPWPKHKYGHSISTHMSFTIQITHPNQNTMKPKYLTLAKADTIAVEDSHVKGNVRSITGENENTCRHLLDEIIRHQILIYYSLLCH